MRAVDRLRRDHEVLRTKLDVLEATLGMTPPTTWFILRELCYTLSRQLQDHIRREEELVTACQQSLSSDVRSHARLEHDEEPQLLRTVNHLFIEEGGKAIEQIRAVLGEFIPRLRRHMEEEEAGLFPAIEQVLGDPENVEAPEPLPPIRLREEMTVNHVLQMYPYTRRIFDQLFISAPYEGYDCLDEVAWRRGMDCCQFLGLLEQAISVGCHCEETAAA